jgi:predicted Zn finger-like uncharacterized protein
MILTCPACGTQYVVKDGAIPEGGRKVRCASCRHSWHQDPPLLELENPLDSEEIAAAEEAAGFAEPGLQADEEPRGDTATGDHAGDEPAAAPGEAIVDGGPVDAAVEEEPAGSDSDYVPAPGGEFADLQPPEEEVDDDFSPFAARGPAERRRRSPLVAILLVIVLVAAAAALFWFLAPPEWKARVGLAEAGQTPLQLMLTHRDRQSLESGNELLAVSGRVINPTTKTQQVPPIQAELRSKSGQLVYRWTIAPPTATLAPGASTPFNSAEVNVPSGGEELTVSLGAPGA